VEAVQSADRGDRGETTQTPSCPWVGCVWPLVAGSGSPRTLRLPWGPVWSAAGRGVDTLLADSFHNHPGSPESSRRLEGSHSRGTGPEGGSLLFPLQATATRRPAMDEETSSIVYVSGGVEPA
jgi:hypothetical protein